MEGETFTESYPAAPDAVSQARNALTAFAREAGAEEEQVESIRLAASEAVTNAVLHAYRDREAGAVQVSASYLENELWMFVADAGSGMRPRSGGPGLGLGLALIAQLADDFQILSRGSGGTELRLRFKLEQARGRAERNFGSRPECRDQSARPGRRGSVSSAFSAA